MLHWKLEFKKLDLKYTWAIARNATDFKVNAFIAVTDGKSIGVGEAAPNIRYAETPELFKEVFEKLELPQQEDLSIEALQQWLDQQELPNALRFGLESTYVHFLSVRLRSTVPKVLGLDSPTSRATAYTIPIMPIVEVENYFNQYQLNRFSFIKIKVDSKNMVDLVKKVCSLTDRPLIIDANEAYVKAEEFLKDLTKLPKARIEFIEQPFPSSEIEQYTFLKPRSPYPVFADESITNTADFDVLAEIFDGINVKLMKAGGYFNAMELLRKAKEKRMKTMVGCMVETGLGISGGLNISTLADYLDLDSFMMLKENPYDMVKEKNGMLFLDVE